MKNFIKYITVLTILFVFTGCSKKDTYSAYFYTNTDNEAPLYLYVDDEYKGLLPLIKVKPTGDNDTLKQKGLFLSLKSGKYKVEAKNASGSIRSSGTIKFKKNKASSTGNVGGQEIFITNECLIVALKD